jgi:3-isopropylmalate dehydratase large subunit
MSQHPRTMFQKIWDDHVVAETDGGEILLYIDRHVVNEVTSPQACEGLRLAGRKVRYPGAPLAVADHNVPTADRGRPIADEQSRIQVATLERNVEDFGIPYVPLRSAAQGIVHVIGPELGLTLPGMTIVCGDSHTSTHGAFGALAFGIGTSEAEHVLATQTLVQKPARNMLVRIEDALAGDPARATFDIDLPGQTIGRDRREAIRFDIAADRKRALMLGLDEIAETLRFESAIAAYEAGRVRHAPAIPLSIGAETARRKRNDRHVP